MKSAILPTDKVLHPDRKRPQQIRLSQFSIVTVRHPVKMVCQITIFLQNLINKTTPLTLLIRYPKNSNPMLRLLHMPMKSLRRRFKRKRSPALRRLCLCQTWLPAGLRSIRSPIVRLHFRSRRIILFLLLPQAHSPLLSWNSPILQYLSRESEPKWHTRDPRRAALHLSGNCIHCTS